MQSKDGEELKKNQEFFRTLGAKSAANENARWRAIKKGFMPGRYARYGIVAATKPGFGV
jgi:hypothetical protein